MRAVFLGFTFAFFIPDPCSAQCYCQYAMVGAHKSMLSPSELSCQHFVFAKSLLQHGIDDIVSSDVHRCLHIAFVTDKKKSVK